MLAGGERVLPRVNKHVAFTSLLKRLALYHYCLDVWLDRVRWNSYFSALYCSSSCLLKLEHGLI